VHVFDADLSIHDPNAYCIVTVAYRPYDRATSSLGSYCSQDPAGLSPSENLYDFGLSQLNWIDPLGLSQAYWLERALQAAGRPLQDGQTAHHIVQQKNPSRYADLSRQILARQGLSSFCEQDRFSTDEVSHALNLLQAQFYEFTAVDFYKSAEFSSQIEALNNMTIKKIANGFFSGR
jgi:hypothetical protein